MRCSPLMLAFILMPLTAWAQETEIENNVPVAAEATTTVVPGKSEDTQQPALQPRQAYTDGQLADPEPKAADLGMAQPGSPVDIKEDATKDD